MKNFVLTASNHRPLFYALTHHISSQWRRAVHHAVLPHFALVKQAIHIVRVSIHSFTLINKHFSLKWRRMLRLDVFLTSVESKLRAPFSSLEIARAISAAPSPIHYLEMISQVLVRMEKVIQLRLLVGLLGVERNDEINVVLMELLTQAQDKTLYEDWTRVAAGLVQGILFSNNDGERDVGTEATSVLVKACGGEDAMKLLGDQESIRKSEMAFSISSPKKVPTIRLT